MALKQLIARAQINGSIQEPGFVFDLKDGEKGPMRTGVSSDHGANFDNKPGDLVDVPLYIDFVEPKAKEPEAIQEPEVAHGASVADDDFKPAEKKAEA